MVYKSAYTTYGSIFVFASLILPHEILLYFTSGYLGGDPTFLLIYFAMFAFMAVVFHKQYGWITVHNVNEDSLYTSLIHALDQMGFECEETRSQIKLKGRNTIVKVNYHSSFATARLSITDQTIVDTNGLIGLLRSQLQNKLLERPSGEGLMWIAAGILLVTYQAFMWIKFDNLF